MAVIVKKLENSENQFIFTFSQAEWDQELEKVTKEAGKDLKVPGFRPGKVPTGVIWNQIGLNKIQSQAINNLVDQDYYKVLKENKITPFGNPKESIVNHPQDKKDPILKVELIQTVYPEVNLLKPKDVTVEIDDSEALVKKIKEQELKNLQSKYAVLKPVDRAAKDGDKVTLDMIAKQDGKEVEKKLNNTIDVEKSLPLPNLYENIKGLKKDDEKTFKSTLQGGDHAGEEADVTIKIKGVKEVELPKLDDNFAKLVSTKDNFKEFEAELNDRIENQAKNEQFSEATQKLEEKLDQTIKIEVPEPIIERMVQNAKYQLMQTLKEPDVKKLNEKLLAEEPKLKEQAIKDAKREIINDAIAKENEIEVQPQEIEMFLTQQAMMYGEKPEDFVKKVVDSGQISYVAQQIRLSKALMDYLKKTKIVDKKGKTINLFDEFPKSEVKSKPKSKKSETK